MTTIVAYISTFSGVALFVIVVAEAIDRRWHLDGWSARVRTWFLGIAVGLLGFLLNVGIFAAANFPVWMSAWLGDVIIGFASALLGNVGFDKLDFFKIALEAVGIRVPAKSLPSSPSGPQ